MTDPCEGKYDIVSRLRDHTNRDDNDIAEAAAYIERLRTSLYKVAWQAFKEESK